MIFSEQWIREWVTVARDRADLLEQLTMAGLEVDGVEPVAGDFTGVVVGEVVSVSQHPDADKLRVCQVSDGEQTQQVVCGAPNVQAGMKVPFARIDAVLPGEQADKPLKIRRAKLRGVESHGMLCSADELGLSDEADGLLALSQEAVPGTDLRDLLQLNDVSITLDLTPNRGDCLGIIGLAREIAALNRADVHEPAMDAVQPVIDDVFPVEILAPEACPRYLGRVIRGVDISAATPVWMQERLRRSGLRSIDPVVDVTNYVLLELGQPMHAFDLAQLQGGIQVRMAGEGEELTLLDGKSLTLQADTLVIADAARALAMAGVMGGKGSAVSSGSRDIFLECAFFAPLAVAGRARRHGLHTDSSHRYERGVDYAIQHRAMERATRLLLDIAGGQPGPVNEQIGQLPEPVRVDLRYARVARVLGMVIPAAEIRDILSRLGLQIVNSSDTDLQVEVPSFRFDISIEADLIEELARVYGYNRLPGSRTLSHLKLREQPETHTPLSRLRERLVGLGYQEVITYSFVEPGLQEQVRQSPAPVPVQNPISSDMSVMRNSLWPGLLQAFRYNANRQQERIRIFECGQVFLKQDGGISQPSRIAGLISGSRQPQLWCNDRAPVDFHDIKGDVESLLSLGGSGELRFERASDPALHAGQCAAVLLDGEQIGLLGALDPALQRELDIDSRVYLFELQLEQLQQAVLPAARELSRFPEVSRDLAVWVDKDVSAADIVQSVREKAGDLLKNVWIFDVYQSDAIDKTKKSIALGLTLQHASRTLGDEDISSIINSCVKELEDKFNAKLRK